MTHAEPLSLLTAPRGFEALDPAQLGGLSDGQRDAIVRTTVAQGPALIRWGHAQQLVRRAVLAGALSVAAALVFMAQSREAETKTSLSARAEPSRHEADAPPTPMLHEELDHSSIPSGSQTRAATRRATRAVTGRSMRSVSLASKEIIGVVEGEPAEVQGEVPVAQLLAQAEILWRKGEHGAARRAFRTAAQHGGPIGEAAWLRLARLELSAGFSEQALKALKARNDRVGNGTLGAEALWLEAEALGRAGRSHEAVEAAQILLRDYPNSAQAPAARKLVAKGKVP